MVARWAPAHHVEIRMRSSVDSTLVNLLQNVGRPEHSSEKRVNFSAISNDAGAVAPVGVTAPL